MNGFLWKKKKKKKKKMEKEYGTTTQHCRCSVNATRTAIVDMNDVRALTPRLKDFKDY